MTSKAYKTWAPPNPHESHDTWPLISRPGRAWCRTCQEHYTTAPEPQAVAS